MPFERFIRNVEFVPLTRIASPVALLRSLLSKCDVRGRVGQRQVETITPGVRDLAVDEVSVKVLPPWATTLIPSRVALAKSLLSRSG